MFLKKIGVVAANTAAQMLGKGVTATTTFISLALIARRFGPSGLGEYTLVLTYTALFYLIVDAGINAIVVKEVVEAPVRFNDRIRLLLGLRLAWAAVLIFGSMAIMAFLPYSTVFRLGVVVMSLTIPLQGLLVSLNASFQAKLSYFRSTLAVMIGGLLSLVIVLLVVVMNFSIFWLFPAALIGLLGSVTVAFYLARGLGVQVLPRFDLGQSLVLVKAAFPLSLTLVLNVIAFRVDVFLLALLTDIAEVGRYNLAYKVFENIITVPTFTLNALYPFLVSAHVQSMVRLKQSAGQAFRGLLGLSLLILVAVLAFSPALVRLLGGNQFGGSTILLRILALSLPFFFLSSLVMWLLITLKQQWHLVWIYSLGLVANVGLNLWLIPRLGATAAALSTGITEALILVTGGMVLLKYWFRERSPGLSLNND